MENVKKLAISVLVPTGNHVLTKSATLVKPNGDEWTHVGQVQTGGDVTQSGVNGLDIGEAVPKTWYCLYLISNGTTMSTLYSTSDCDPVMPSGYEYKTLVGFCYLQETGGFYKQLQVGNTVYPKAFQLLMPEPDTTNQNTWVNISLTDFLPPNDWAWEAQFYGIHEANYANPGQIQAYMALRSYLLFNSEFVLFNKELYQHGRIVESGHNWFVIDEGQNDIFYYVSSDGPTTYKTRLFMGAYKVRLF